MVTATIEQAQQDLQAYLKLVQSGETVVLTQENQPIAEIKRVGQPLAVPRPFGLCSGAFVVPDDFDAPLPDDIVQAFEGQ